MTGEREKMEQIELSVLMTQEDYMAFLVQKRRMQRGRKFQTALYVGGLLAVAAIAGFFFGDSIGMSAASAAGLLLVAVVLMVFDAAIAPLFDRITAARDYAEKESLRTACLYRFTENEVYLRGGRIEGTLPLGFMTGWMHTPDYFTLSFGRETSLFIPKRLLGQEQCSQLEKWLRTADTGIQEKGRR